MTHKVEAQEAHDWLCGSCGTGLEFAETEVSYMGSKYPADLLRCPMCGIVFIPEGLALGEMAEIEKILEDK